MDISAQKYKIWVNTSWLVFLSNIEYRTDRINIPIHLLVRDPKPARIIELIEKLQLGKIEFPIFILTKNKVKTWKLVLGKMKIVNAAGGLVQNSDLKYLFFFRRGSWDLPKGKLDKGEKNKYAAIREVKEEVGLDCKIISQLPFTYHTYMEKGKMVLKETAWYKMKSLSKKVRLQYEEDIERYRWVRKEQFSTLQNKIYPNLLAILKNEFDY